MMALTLRPTGLGGGIDKDRSDCALTANNKSAARRAGTPVARRDILWATCRTVGRATSASQAEFL